MMNNMTVMTKQFEELVEQIKENEDALVNRE